MTRYNYSQPEKIDTNLSFPKLILRIVVLFGFLHTSFGVSALFQWKDQTGQILPFQSREEVEDFLRTADIVDQEKIKIGTTKPHRVILEKDGIRMKACFRDVYVYKRKMRLESGATKHNFTDKAVYEIAAYELGKLLGLKNIPPTVLREIKGREGTLQAWVEGTMMEKDRQEKNIAPPRVWNFGMQGQIMLLFDQLIYNEDRNLGNFLIDEKWNLWMIDHTRSFRIYSSLTDKDSIKFCERNLWTRLQNLNKETLEEKLSGYLSSNEIKSILKRKDKLVDYIQQLIDDNGEKRILFRFPSVVEGVLEDL